MKTFLVFVILLAFGAGAAWFIAGRAAGPAIQIAQPTKAIGPNGDLTVVIDTPHGRLTHLDVALEQNGKRLPVFSLMGEGASQVVREGDHLLRLTLPIGK